MSFGMTSQCDTGVLQTPAGTTLTQNLPTVNANDNVRIFISHSRSGNVTSVTIGGVAATLGLVGEDISDGQAGRNAYLINASGGAVGSNVPVVVTFDITACPFSGFYADAWSGCGDLDGEAIFCNEGSGPATSFSSGNITTTDADLVLSAITDTSLGDNLFSAGGGFTPDLVPIGTIPSRWGGAEHLVQGAPATIAGTWTGSNGIAVCGVIAFKPSGGGGGGGGVGALGGHIKRTGSIRPRPFAPGLAR